jgi:hypothetical protein
MCAVSEHPYAALTGVMIPKARYCEFVCMHNFGPIRQESFFCQSHHSATTSVEIHEGLSYGYVPGVVALT